MQSKPEPLEAHRWKLEQKEPGAQSHRYVCACGSTGGWWTSLGAEAEGLRHERDALRAALSVSTSDEGTPRKPAELVIWDNQPGRTGNQHRRTYDGWVREFEGGAVFTSVSTSAPKETSEPRDERRFPVLGSRPPATISWTQAEEAYAGYARIYPGSARAQSIERIAERGGFSEDELREFCTPGATPEPAEPREETKPR